MVTVKKKAAARSAILHSAEDLGGSYGQEPMKIWPRFGGRPREGEPALVAASLADIPRAKGLPKSPISGVRAGEPLQGVVAGRQPKVCRYSKGGAGA
jgi:hypothetical protein